MCRPYNRITVHVEYKNRSYAINGMGSWNHLRMIQKVMEQHTGKHDINELQKIAMLGAVHTLQKVLM
jgi:hypothetical protein